MNRRRSIQAGCGFLIGTLSGCVGRFDPFDGSQNDLKRVQFEESESEYAVVLQNDLNTSTTGTVAVAGPDGGEKERSVSIESGDSRSFPGLIATGGGQHTIVVAADEKSVATAIEPGGSPYDKFTFTISRSEITFREGYRPSAHLVMSNELEKAVDSRVEVRNPATGSAVYDVVTVPQNNIESYLGVFRAEREYNVTVKANGGSKSISFLNSKTNSVSVRITGKGLQLETASD